MYLSMSTIEYDSSTVVVKYFFNDYRYKNEYKKVYLMRTRTSTSSSTTTLVVGNFFSIEVSSYFVHYFFSLVVKCPPLTPPTNGFFVSGECSNTVHSACALRCSAGYELNGRPIRMCFENGTWSGEPAVCKGGLFCSHQCVYMQFKCERRKPVMFIRKARNLSREEH